MHDDSTAVTVTPLPVARHGDATIREVLYDGKLAMFAVDVGRACGLARPEQAVEKIVNDPEAEDGIEYVVLGRAALGSIQNNPQNAGVDISAVDARVTSVTLLLEPGYWRLLAGARTGKGKAFRRWLFREHLPAVRVVVAPTVRAVLPAPSERVVGTRAEARMLAAEARARAVAANAEVRKEIEAMRIADRERRATIAARAREREAEARLATIAERKAAREAREARKRRR